jgi:predicted phage terminase large subunit-like protein
VVLGIFRPSPDKPMSVMLIDCWTEHMKYPDLRPRVIEEASSIYGDENEFGNGKKVDQILIEDKSAGISLIQDLQRAGLNVRAYNPGKADKTARLNLISPIIAKGLMYIPESQNNQGAVRTWAEAFLNQVCSFPETRHDDYVDALTQGLRLLRDMGLLTVDYLYNDEDLYADDTKPKYVNPYSM